MHMGLGIKTILLNLVYKSIVAVGYLFSKLNHTYAFQKIKLNKNIHLGINVKISSTAKIETRYGGKIKIGNGTEILDGVLILTYGGNIEIGDNCSINPYTIIYGHGGTSIGNDNLIAGHCMIVPNNHIIENINIPIRLQGNTQKGVTIDNNVWIGHGCSILDGSNIANGVVVAAGSVVKGNIEENTVIAGVPAKILRKRKL